MYIETEIKAMKPRPDLIKILITEKLIMKDFIYIFPYVYHDVSQ